MHRTKSLSTKSLTVAGIAMSELGQKRHFGRPDVRSSPDSDRGQRLAGRLLSAKGASNKAVSQRAAR
jgi:hypothetical protein